MTQHLLTEMRAELELIRREAREELAKRLPRDPSQRRARTERRLYLERALAAATGQQFAEPIALDGALPEPWRLISRSTGQTALLCGSRASAGGVLLQFSGVLELRFEGLDAEPFEEHAR